MCTVNLWSVGQTNLDGFCYIDTCWLCCRRFSFCNVSLVNAISLPSFLPSFLKCYLCFGLVFMTLIKDFALRDSSSQHFLQPHRSHPGVQACTGCISPCIHPSYASLAHLSQLTRAHRPAGVSAASSRHGVGYSPAISHSQRRILCQHSDHDGGRGELGWRRAEGVALKRGWVGWMFETMPKERPAAGSYISLAPTSHASQGAHGSCKCPRNVSKADHQTPNSVTFPAPPTSILSMWTIIRWIKAFERAKPVPMSKANVSRPWDKGHGW